MEERSITKISALIEDLQIENIQGLTIKFQDCALKTGKKVSKKIKNFFYSKYIPFESTQRWARASKPRSARSKSVCGIVFRAAVRNILESLSFDE